MTRRWQLWPGRSGSRDAFAKADKRFKEEVYKASQELGLEKLQTKNPELDKRLGQIAVAGKAAGETLAGERERIGGMLAAARKIRLAR